jgi:hypothetical protein
MKTIKLFFFAAVVLAAGFFTSCTDDTTATGPVIEFISGTGILTADATVTTGQEFSFKWIVTQGTAKLSEFTIRLENADVTGFPNTDVPSDSYSDTYTTSKDVAGVYEYTFIATDKDGLQDTKTIVVTVQAAGVDVDSYTDIILGADNNATLGSSFASIDGSIYLLADAKTNSDKVDFVYFYGATNKATIAAPSDADAQTVFSSPTSGIATWTVKNATSLATTTLTAAQFDAIATDLDIAAVTAGTVGTKVNNLAVGNVIYFETASTSANPSKKGLAKVTALTAEKTGSVTLQIKVTK